MSGLTNGLGGLSSRQQHVGGDVSHDRRFVRSLWTERGCRKLELFQCSGAAASIQFAIGAEHRAQRASTGRWRLVKLFDFAFGIAPALSQECRDDQPEGGLPRG